MGFWGFFLLLDVFVVVFLWGGKLVCFYYCLVLFYCTIFLTDFNMSFTVE